MKTNVELTQWSVNPKKVLSGGTEGYEINHGSDGEVVAEFVYTKEDAKLIAAAPNMAHVLQQIWDCYETKGQLLAFNVSLVREVLEQALGNTETPTP